jgi:hypothetical protein
MFCFPGYTNLRTRAGKRNLEAAARTPGGPTEDREYNLNSRSLHHTFGGQNATRSSSKIIGLILLWLTEYMHKIPWKCRKPYRLMHASASMAATRPTSNIEAIQLVLVASAQTQ